ncbi:hypothetical protein C0J52_04802 [Blattella germanica]|nr:hypothetical protein C0J52_04802 [Blattella germanica]
MMDRNGELQNRTLELPQPVGSRKKSHHSLNTSSRSFSLSSGGKTAADVMSSTSSCMMSSKTSDSSAFGEYICQVFDNEDVMEDPRLMNWQRWIELRKRLYKQMEEITGRTPPMLVMNSTVEKRYIKEEKCALEQARVYIKPDKYRGSPYDYLPPILLSNKGKEELPDCEVTRTKLEKGIIVPLTYVGIPEPIQEEKSLSGPTGRPSLKDIWRNSDYLRMKENIEGHEISNIRSHRPTLELILKGQSIETRTEEQNLQSSVPVITVSDASDMSEGEDERSSLRNIRTFAMEQDFSTVRLKVQNTLYYRESKSTTTPTNATYAVEGDDNFDFTYAASVKEISMQHLRLENTGSAKLTYYWVRTTKHDNLKMPVKPSSFFSHFLFNRGRSIILPGKVDVIPMWFCSKRPGIFQEFWNLIIVPFVTEKGKGITFRFWGIARAEPMHLARVSRIEAYLNRRVGEYAVVKADEELAKRYLHQEPPPEGTKPRFLDEKYFLLKNPKYFYHPSVVTRLSQLYREVMDNPDAEWDFNIKCLRALIIGDRSDLKKQEERLGVLSENVKLLLQPCLTPIKLDYKYCSVRDILGNLANNIEKDAESLKLKHTFKIVGSVQNSARSVITPRSSSEKLRRTLSLGGSRTKKKNVESRSRQGLASRKSSSLALQGQESFVTDERKYALYKEALFVKVYSHLGIAVEQISSVLDSINATK